MKIREVIGSVADRDQEAVAPFGNLMQRIANQFTRTGQVKRPLDLQPLVSPLVITRPPFSAAQTSREDIPTAASADGVRNAAQPLGAPFTGCSADQLCPTGKDRLGLAPVSINESLK